MIHRKLRVTEHMMVCKRMPRKEKKSCFVNHKTSLSMVYLLYQKCIISNWGLFSSADEDVLKSYSTHIYQDKNNCRCLIRMGPRAYNKKGRNNFFIKMISIKDLNLKSSTSSWGMAVYKQDYKLFAWKKTAWNRGHSNTQINTNSALSKQK